jgi:hypothetical protein
MRRGAAESVVDREAWTARRGEFRVQPRPWTLVQAAEQGEKPPARFANIAVLAQPKYVLCLPCPVWLPEADPRFV